MAYPGRAVRIGSGRSDLVRQVQERLDAIGCGPLDVDGVFGQETVSAVKLFQTRNSLREDGVVGPNTWDVLFRETPVDVRQPASPLLAGTLETARSQMHVREIGRNRGPEIDRYLQAVGLDPTKGSYPWCISFVYWCFDQAARSLAVPNPCVRTAGVLDNWAKAPERARILADAAADDPRLVQPGAIFVVDHGHGRGHAGLVTAIQSGVISTIEGNTNQAGSREGDGVHERRRSIATINTGFIDYSL